MVRKNNTQKAYQRNIKDLISEQKIEDCYILDKENAIVVIKNLYEHMDNYRYEMIHERVINGIPEVVNRWYIESYYFGYGKEIIMKDFNLFRVQNGRGTFDALYDYKVGKFVVSQGIWDKISFWKEYDGFLSSFNISSDYEEGDIISYINPVTGENMTKSFKVEDGKYYAMLDLDGTIRENHLFKGKDFSRIKNMVELDRYESLEEFKKVRKQFCNDLKKKNKEEYYQMIEARNDGSISPYMDQEVLNVLQKRK